MVTDPHEPRSRYYLLHTIYTIQTKPPVLGGVHRTSQRMPGSAVDEPINTPQLHLRQWVLNQACSTRSPNISPRSRRKANVSSPQQKPERGAEFASGRESVANRREIPQPAGNIPPCRFPSLVPFTQDGTSRSTIGLAYE